MRLVLIIALLALTGCASWFRSDQPKAETPSQAKVVTQLDAAKGYLADAAKAKDAAEYKRKIELAERAAKIARDDADSAQARASKAAALADVAGYCAWAIGLGLVIFFGSNIPFVGPFLAPLRQAAGATVVLAAVIAVGAPWLSDLLGDQKVRWAGYAAFGIIAISASIAGAWWLLDKARDAVNRR